MKALVIAIAAIALILVGVLFVGGVSPLIVVAPETVFHPGGHLAIGPLTIWDGNVTNTMFTSWCVVALIVLSALIANRGLRLIPSGFAAYIEGAVVALFNIVEQVAGPQNARRFFPLIGTIFFYILVSNYAGLLPINAVIGLPEPGHGERQAVFQQTDVPLLGEVAYIPFQPTMLDIAGGDEPIVPAGAEGHGARVDEAEAFVSNDAVGAASDASGVEAEGDDAAGTFSGVLAPWFRSVNTDINAPLAIALFSFVFVEFWGFQSLGGAYLKKFFAFGALIRKGPMGIIDVFVGLLEFVSELSRIVSFTFRLFGNIFAGEVLLLMMTFLVPFVVVNVFYGLELFVGLIQAFVFAMLTLVFAVTAVSTHGEGEHAGESPDRHAEEHHGAH